MVFHDRRIGAAVKQDVSSGAHHCDPQVLAADGAVFLCHPGNIVKNAHVLHDPCIGLQIPDDLGPEQPVKHKHGKGQRQEDG